MGHIYICGKEVRQASKLFLKKTQIIVVFRTRNTINNILKYHTQTDKYISSVMHQLEGLIWQLKYVVKPGTGLNIKYIDHIHAIKIIIVIPAIQIVY
jgi:hypothetical protein